MYKELSKYNTNNTTGNPIKKIGKAHRYFIEEE